MKTRKKLSPTEYPNLFSNEKFQQTKKLEINKLAIKALLYTLHLTFVFIKDKVRYIFLTQTMKINLRKSNFSFFRF